MNHNQITLLKRGLNLFGISNSKVAKDSGISATYVGSVLNQTITTDSEKTRTVLNSAANLLTAAKEEYDDLLKVA